MKYLCVLTKKFHEILIKFSNISLLFHEIFCETFCEINCVVFHEMFCVVFIEIFHIFTIFHIFAMVSELSHIYHYCTLYCSSVIFSALRKYVRRTSSQIIGQAHKFPKISLLVTVWKTGTPQLKISVTKK